MREVEFFEGLIEVLVELTTIVGVDIDDLSMKKKEQTLEEIFDTQGGTRCVHSGKGNLGMVINGG